jgi:TM2 domain-containing membrane protein YozV
MTKPLSATDLILIEQQVANEGPSLGVAYALWLFLGLLSGHRFYLKRGGSAVTQIMSYFVFIGFIWWFIDLFLIPKMVAEERQVVRSRLMARRAEAATVQQSALPPAGVSDDPAVQLAKLWSLKEAGALTEAEFESPKARLLGAT